MLFKKFFVFVFCFIALNANCNEVIKTIKSKKVYCEYEDSKYKDCSFEVIIDFIEFFDNDMIVYGSTIKKETTKLYGFKMKGLYFVFTLEDYKFIFVDDGGGDSVVSCKLFHNVSVEISEIYYEIIVEKIGNVLLLYNTFNGNKTFFLRINM